MGFSVDGRLIRVKGMRFRVDGRLIRVKGMRFRVDGRMLRVKRYTVSKISGFVWTGPYRLFLYETKVQETLNNQTLTVS